MELRVSGAKILPLFLETVTVEKLLPPYDRRPVKHHLRAHKIITFEHVIPDQNYQRRHNGYSANSSSKNDIKSYRRSFRIGSETGWQQTREASFLPVDDFLPAIFEGILLISPESALVRDHDCSRPWEKPIALDVGALAVLIEKVCGIEALACLRLGHRKIVFNDGETPAVPVLRVPSRAARCCVTARCSVTSRISAAAACLSTTGRWLAELFARIESRIANRMCSLFLIVQQL